MKILFLARLYLDLDEHLGVKKKVQSQVSAMQSLGHTVDVLTLDRFKQGILLNDEVVRSIPKSKLSRILFFYNKAYRVFASFVRNYDLIYIRYQWSDPSFIHLVKNIHSNNIPLFLEFPGYPIKSNVRTYFDRIRYLMDVFFGKHLRKYVSQTGNYSHYSETYGIPSISLSNGIHGSLISSNQRRIQIGKDLCLLGIANISSWHGYDRIIKGIRKYKDQNRPRKIIFKIIGDGSAKNDLEQLTRQLKLEDEIQFHPPKYNDELSRFYDDADIGVGSLGFFRANQTYGSTLKLREYAAKGIPFIYGYEDQHFEHCAFAKKYENNNTTIDIQSILDFYDSLDPETPNIMRTFALNHLTWTGIMKNLFKQIGLS